MQLDPARRATLVADLLVCLRAAVPGSRALLRGSLAAGGADQYSDIDLLWEVPDDVFAACVARLATILAGVRPLESLRLDPDLQRSDRRRLAFVRFAGLPLFWRVDLDIVAQSVGHDPRYDLDNPAARGADWSPAESALANAVAAVKAHLRGRDAEALGLLRRAYGRVGLIAPDRALPALIVQLVDGVAAIEPSTAAFGRAIKQLVAAAF